jgi:Flp pilus assembly pilin Flp
MIQMIVERLIALYYEEEGQTLFEYALILTLVSVTAVAVLTVLGAFPGSIFSQLTSDL